MNHRKKTQTQLTALLLTFLSIIIVFSLAPKIVFADPTPERNSQGYIIYKPQVEIPGEQIVIQNNTRPIGVYIRNLYVYATSIVGILATVVMMFGGIIWMTAYGSASRVGEAKAWIGAALTGLLLVMTSYMIMQTINPALVNLKTRNIPTAQEMGENTFARCGEGYDNGDLCQDKDGVSGHCRPLAGNSCDGGCVCDPNYKKPVNSCENQNECDPCIDFDGRKGVCQYATLAGTLFCKWATYGCCQWYNSEGQPVCAEVPKVCCTTKIAGPGNFYFYYDYNCDVSTYFNNSLCVPN